jgi:hypothetical protein
MALWEAGIQETTYLAYVFANGVGYAVAANPTTDATNAANGAPCTSWCSVDVAPGNIACSVVDDARGSAASLTY